MPATRTIRVTAALLGACLLAAPAAAASTGGTPRPGTHVFAEDSFWYRTLPDDTPTAPDSAEVVAALVQQGEEHYGRPGRPTVTVNTESFAPPLYRAEADDPVVAVGFDNCQGKADDDLYVERLFTGPDAPMRTVRMPADATPAQGSDGEIVVYDAVDDRVVELWKMRRHDDGGVSACWGGVIEDVSSSDGVFPHPYGTTASGLSLLGGTVSAAEFAQGRIGHVVGIALPFSAEAPAVSAPANRTDGVNPQGLPVPAQGQMLRLPAELDLDALALSPSSRALAEAAQDHGLIVWDTAGAVSFRGENPASIAQPDFYAELFRGRGAGEELSADGEDQDPFPLEQLEVLPRDYAAPAPPEPAAAAERDGAVAALAPWVLLGGGLLLVGAVGVRVAARR